MEYKTMVSYVYKTIGKKGKVSPQSDMFVTVFNANPWAITERLLGEMANTLAVELEKEYKFKLHSVQILSYSQLAVEPDLTEVLEEQEVEEENEEQKTVDEAIEETEEK